VMTLIRVLKSELPVGIENTAAVRPAHKSTKNECRHSKII